MDDFGKKFKIGLFHGPVSGHVLVHCNAKIVLIDFKVLHTKTYSFFIEDELCELIIEKKDGQFFYDFSTNKQVDTPLNRSRKRLDKKHWLQTLLVFGALLVVITLFTLIFQNRKKRQYKEQMDQMLSANSRESTAKVFIDKKKGVIQYSFIANSRIFDSEIPVQDVSSGLISENGMPLESGDEFQLSYAIKNPSIHKINYLQPSEQQLAIYFQRTFKVHAELHPELPEAFIRCLLEIAFELKGLEGIASFYFQNTPAAISPDHNRLTYLRLTRDIPFQKKMKDKCW